MEKLALRLRVSNKQYRWGTVAILLLAALLRFYQLGEVPHGMTWDEAAIGYNGFAIWETRRDEWLTFLPISFWSFGDYKAPLAIYFNGLFTTVFGMNLWAVRLPFVLAGLGSGLSMIYLTRVLWQHSGAKLAEARWFALLSGGLLAVSPWHLHFSRAGFESGMALMFLLWALYFFFQALRVKEYRRQVIDFCLAAVGLVASIYSYHSAKIVVPLLAVSLLIGFRKQLVKRAKPALISAGLGVIGLAPFIYDSFFGKGLTRASTLVIGQGNSLIADVILVAKQWLAHLTPRFLLMGETTTFRHGDGSWGVLLLTTAVLVLLGFWSLLKNRNKALLVIKIAALLIVIGLLPAALGAEVPHSNRSLLALPGFLLLAGGGVRVVLNSKLTAVAKQAILGSLLLFHGLLVISYLQHYYSVFARESAADWQDGYLETFTYTLPYERGEAGREPVDKIIFTSDYGQPYIYALFARETNPIEYQGGSLIKYEFKEEVTVGDLDRENTLVVASSEDELFGANDQADHVIYGSDGSVRFRIYYRP